MPRLGGEGVWPGTTGRLISCSTWSAVFAWLRMWSVAVGARYRLSPKSRKDLADNLAATLNSLGDQLLPPEV